MKYKLNPFIIATGLVASIASPLVHGATATKEAPGTDLSSTAIGDWSGGTGTNGSPTTADVATWSALSSTGAHTVSSPVSWGSMSLSGHAAPVSITGSDITLASGGANSTTILSNSTQALTIDNNIVATAVNNSAGIAIGNNTTRIQISATATTTLNGSVTSTGGANANDVNLTIRGSGAGTIGGTLTVDGQLAKGDSGTWTLNGANSIGWITISNGALLGGNDSAFGTGTIYLQSGGSNITLASADSTARNFGNKVDFAQLAFASTARFGQTSGGTGALTFGELSLGTAIFNLAVNANTSFTSVSGTTGGITKTGTGTLTLAGTNSTTGGTTISAGTILLGNDGSLGSTPITISNGGTVATGTLGVVSGSGDRVLSNDITIAGTTGNTLAVNTANGNITLNGNITDSGAFSLKLAKSGANILTLAGAASNFTGGTTISHSGDLTAGVVVGNASALGTGAVLVNGAQNFKASLAVNAGLTVTNALTLKRGQGGSNRAVLGLGASSDWNGSITVDNTSANGIAVILAGGTSTATASIVSGNIGFSTLGTGSALVLRGGTSFGKVSGSVSLSTGTVQTTDSSNWEFSNASNTWGTLDINHASAIVTTGAANTLSSTGVVSSSVGGTLRLNNQAGTTAYSQTIAGLSGNVKVGLATGSATLTLNTTADQDCSGVISGAISLVKSGSAKQTLTGANTYTGSTTISEGTLILGTTGAISAGDLSISTATLDLRKGTATRAQTVNNLSLSDATLEIGLNASPDSITVNGTATVSGSNTLKLHGSLPVGTYNLISTSAPLTGSLSIDTTDVPVPSSYSAAIVGNNYVLTVTASAGFDSWIASKGLTAAAAAFDADPDNDGLDNGLEFVLGGEPNPANPGSNSADLLPKVAQSAGNMTFTFKRKDISESSAALTFQWSTDLSFPSPANDIPVGAVDSTTDTITVDVTEDLPDADTDTIIITVPAAKAAAGKVFGRLKAVKLP